MRSINRRRAELTARRSARLEKKARPPRRSRWPATVVAVNRALLAPYNSYGVPAFVQRGKKGDAGAVRSEASPYPAPHQNPARMFDAAEELKSRIPEPVFARGPVYVRLD